MYKIIILDDMAYIRYRVKQLLAEEGIEIYEAATSFDFFNKLYDKKNEINLIILEVGLSTEDGFEVLKKIKAMNLKIPIMVLTKMNTRIDFITCIKEGISEYILKPFDPKMFLRRIDNLIVSHEKGEEPEEIIYLNFKEYMIKQISKAKEENTKVSIMMVSLVKPGSDLFGEKIDIKETYLILIDSVYEKLKSLFKLPDLFVKHGFSNFVGVIPWKDKNPMDKIEKSVQNRYGEVKNKDSRYKEYEIECVFVTYPEDGQESEELLDNLEAKMQNKINGSDNQK
ncbi:transcriptional regulator [Clostridium carboxidivorans P7]|uniref:Stage 0 sporulation protein A homolog n=1 Tax=Clostridium carboxidivorans P7 TaxID=536227 RepID=C6Q001_9CLOT|nr:response regulator [Clostridium carboxidivorans]AKN32137.1 transcriptional regulator [Clostridium carboxidivorans P7]EET85175.1 response regulator receiver protein [Clostridium carboxidivorans P7]